MSSNQISSKSLVRNVSAVALFACASALGVQAQETTSSANSVSTSTAAPSNTLFASVNAHPMDLASLAGAGYSSSSSSVSSSSDAMAGDPGTLDLRNPDGSAMQPPPRRRYGSPRYSDKSHNADGSNKYTFVGAVGFTLPTGNTYHYYNTSYGFQVGGGRNFNKHFGVLAQFDYDKFYVNGQTLQNQQTLYTAFGSPIPGLDANSHIWSFTVNPIYHFYSGEGLGAYVVGGVGFYHKVTNFTAPEQGTYFDPYYGYVTYQANANIDTYTSNAPGFNGGLGLTYKFSRFAEERLFVEARYVFLDNSQRFGLTAANLNTPAGQAYPGNNYFPANSNRTTYIPIKVGIRF